MNHEIKKHLFNETISFKNYIISKTVVNAEYDWLQYSVYESTDYETSLYGTLSTFVNDGYDGIWGRLGTKRMPDIMNVLEYDDLKDIISIYIKQQNDKAYNIILEHFPEAINGIGDYGIINWKIK